MSDNNRVVVLLSGNGSTLQAILDQQSEYQYEVVGVLSNRPGAYGLTRAESAGVPCEHLDHKAFPDRESFDQSFIEKIDQYKPDLLVLAGYMRILSPLFVKHYQGRLINIHPSLLPKHKGLNTYQSALDAGDDRHGTTVHFVTEELDSGANLIQASLAIGEQDTASTLEQRVKVMEQKIYPMAIDWLTSGRMTLQDGVLMLDKQPLGARGYLLEEQNLE